MSFNNTDFGRAFGHAWALAQRQGSVGGSGSGSGGRRGGSIRKDTKPRCHRCRSTEHLIADCPHKDVSRRKIRQRLREARSAQDTRPAPVQQPALVPPPPPAAAPPVLPGITAREPASAWYVDVPSRDPTQSDTPSAPAPAPASAQRQQVATELEMLNAEQRAIEERLIAIRRRRQQLLQQVLAQQLQANTQPEVEEEDQDQD